MKQIDIIMVNFNSTDKAIESIKHIEQNADGITQNLFVVDNASKDHPRRFEQRFPYVTCIYNSINLGYSKAINQALRKSDSPYVVIMNPDTIVITKFWDELIHYLDNHHDVGIIGPKILERDGSIQGSARRFPTVLTSLFGRKSPITRLFPNNPITQKEFLCFNSPEQDVVDVDWISGACMIIRRNLLEKIGGFDERFFLYWEDTDVCKQIKNLGYRVVYYKRAVIKHFVGESSNTRPIRSICHFHFSCLKLFLKYVHGKMFFLIPLAFAGLSLRCVFVIFLSILKRAYLLNSAFISKFFSTISSPYQGIQKNFSPPRIKLLRVVSKLNISAHAIHIELLSKHMNTHRFETIVVAGNIASSEELDMSDLFKSNRNGKFYKITVLKNNAGFIKNISAFMQLTKIILKEQPDIIHTHLNKARLMARGIVSVYNLFCKHKIKMVHTYHGSLNRKGAGQSNFKFSNLSEKVLARFTDAIVAVSHTQRWEIVEKYGIADSRKVHLINVGTKYADVLTIDRRNGAFRKKIGVDPDVILIGIVGNMNVDKNHFMFLNAAKSIISRASGICVKFILVGDGELRPQLERYAQKAGLEDHVIFHGWEKDIHALYADIDILSVTSSYDDIPMPVIEAMASNVPVITTGVGGVKELLGRIYNIDINPNGFKLCERGVLCPKDDIESFINGLEYMLKNGSMLDSERLENARRFVVDQYSTANMIKQTEGIYDKVLGR